MTPPLPGDVFLPRKTVATRSLLLHATGPHGFDACRLKIAMHCVQITLCEALKLYAQHRGPTREAVALAPRGLMEQESKALVWAPAQVESFVAGMRAFTIP